MNPRMRGRAAFMHAELLRVIGASGNHVIAMGFDGTEGDTSDKSIVFKLQCGEADGPHVSQDWEGM
eukprot:1991612-Alexandrium_andersonii.AAC.1